MLILKQILNEVLASKCQRIANVKIHKHLEIVMAQSFLNSVHNVE